MRSRLALVLTAVLAAASAAHASTDETASRVLVPLVWRDKMVATRLFVTNHETFDVKAQVRYVGERGGPVPGLKVCGSVNLLAGRLTDLDYAAVCQLPPDPGQGAVVLIQNSGGVARLSARARLDAISPMTGAILGTFPVQGLPLGALDTTENQHVVQGLRPGSPMSASVTTDCFFGSTFDGSGKGGMVGRLDLLDAGGGLLGSTLFTLRPFELLALRDVFTLLGISPSVGPGVRAEVVWSGFGDAVYGYCLAAHAGAKKGDRTYGFELMQVANPNDDLRRRDMMASDTPFLSPFLMPGLPFGTTAVAHHGVYLRHPDRITCGVASGDPNAPMRITAVAPDGTRIGGQPSRTPEFATVPHGSVSMSGHEMWGLEIEWVPGNVPPGVVPYTIDCRSGNGASLADFLF